MKPTAEKIIYWYISNDLIESVNIHVFLKKKKKENITWSWMKVVLLI